MKMMQHGGEGKESYKSHKNSSGMKQHGGEGTAMKTSSKGVTMLKPNGEYCGPGRYLKTMS